MAIPLDETSDAPQEIPLGDKADAAFGSNPEGMPQGHFFQGTRHMAPIAALLAPHWELPNRVARALHWGPSVSFAHVA